MTGNTNKNTLSELWQILFVLMLVYAVDARLREDYAEFVVSCDDSAMRVQMTFKHPFRGIVFVPEHYYDPTCSYSVPPNSTALQITLILPHDSCKMRLLNSSNKLIGFNTVVVFHHRMLETIYDYTHNVSCGLKHPIKDLNKNIWHEPLLKSWITFENPLSILPEHVADKMGVGETLLLAYHVKDKGVNRDMLVMNCIGHDTSTVSERTKFYQLTNPFGCSSETDLVSDFTVIRNPIGRANMIAYAIIRNFSMVIRRRLYITCGAQICKDRCEKKCDGIHRQQSLYFNDIVTKGFVSRPEDAKRPASLTAFERFDRHRRSHPNIEQNATDQQNGLLLEKITAVSPYSVLQHNGTNQTSQINQNRNMLLLPDIEKHIRTKRAINDMKTEVVSSGLKVILIKSDNTVDVKKSTVKMQFAPEIDAESFISENSSNLCKTDSVVKVKMTYEPQHSSRIDDDKSEQFTFSSFLRALISILALIGICGACYTVFSFSQSDSVSVPDFASQSHI